MEKIKVVHLHSDYKFLRDSNRFEGDFFDNTLVIIERNSPYEGPFREQAVILQKEDYEGILRICEGAEVVVLYKLDELKTRISLALPAEVKIVWRFFGYELYRKIPQQVLSPQTRKLTKRGTLQSRLMKLVTPPGEKEVVFNNSVRRINSIFCIFEEEYDFLQSQFKQLPPLVLLNFTFPIPPLKKKRPGSCTIVVGNSKGIYNNHLDAIEVILSAKRQQECSFKFLFSYGSENAYTKEVRERVKVFPNFELMEEFLEFEEFEELYDEVVCFVHNSYRQMAFGNIFIALKKGIKIYLNRKNPTFAWLRRKGFLIFPIEDLSGDIDNNKLALSFEEMEENYESLRQLKKEYSQEEFQRNLLKTLGMERGELV